MTEPATRLGQRVDPASTIININTHIQKRHEAKRQKASAPLWLSLSVNNRPHKLAVGVSCSATEFPSNQPHVDQPHSRAVSTSTGLSLQRSSNPKLANDNCWTPPPLVRRAPQEGCPRGSCLFDMLELFISKSGKLRDQLRGAQPVSIHVHIHESYQNGSTPASILSWDMNIRRMGPCVRTARVVERAQEDNATRVPELSLVNDPCTVILALTQFLN